MRIVTEGFPEPGQGGIVVARLERSRPELVEQSDQGPGVLGPGQGEVFDPALQILDAALDGLVGQGRRRGRGARRPSGGARGGGRRRRRLRRGIDPVHLRPRNADSRRALADDQEITAHLPRVGGERPSVLEMDHVGAGPRSGRCETEGEGHGSQDLPAPDPHPGVHPGARRRDRGTTSGEVAPVSAAGTAETAARADSTSAYTPQQTR